MLTLVRLTAFATGLVAALALLVEPPAPGPPARGPLELEVSVAPHPEVEVHPSGVALEGRLDPGSGAALHGTVEVRNRTPQDRTWWLVASEGSVLHPAVHLRITGPAGPVLDGRLDSLTVAAPLTVPAGASVTLALSAMRADEVPVAVATDVAVVLDLSAEARP